MDKKTAEIRKIVKDICEKDGKMQWEMHVTPVLDNAMRLAKMLNADKKVVEISVYLHDIARLKGKPNHEIEGAKMAEKILSKLGYPKPFIEKVRYCILNHRSSFKECKTLEAKILNSADAMAHFDNIPWMFWVAIREEKKELKDAFEWVDKKVDKGWNNKIQLPEAREIARPKYEAAKLLLDSSRGYLYGRKN
jgi:uncharacterized protein